MADAEIEPGLVGWLALRGGDSLPRTHPLWFLADEPEHLGIQGTAMTCL